MFVYDILCIFNRVGLVFIDVIIYINGKVVILILDYFKVIEIGEKIIL